MNDMTIIEKNRPFFSVIVPVYNVEQYLPECIDSILKQTYKNCEIILVDDGSFDNSGKICDEYSDKYDFIRVIHCRNGGLSFARNRGLSMANGKYILFLDSDDYLSNNLCFEILEKKVAEYPYDFVLFKSMKYYGDEQTIDYYGDYDEKIFKKSKAQIFLYMVRANKQLACAWNKIIRADVLKDNNIKFIEGIVGEDIPWIVELFRVSENIGVDNTVFHMYRQGRANSITNASNIKGIDDLFKSIKQIVSEYRGKKDEFSQGVLSFMAFEYAILLLNISKHKKIENLKEVERYKWLLKYALDKKTKTIKCICSILGIRGTLAILRKVK